jgi:hypothetical protein
MNIELQVPEYSPSEGFRFVWDEGYEISTVMESEGMVLRANVAGLRSLARHLLGLAQAEIPSGYHIRLDDSTSLEQNSCSMIFERRDSAE